MTEFEKKCVERIPPDELRNITDEVHRRTKLAFSRLGDLPVEYCTECEKMYRREHLIKTHCVIDVVRMTATCAWHFASELEEKLCKEYMEMLDRTNKPKEPFPVAELKHGSLVPLDVEDFARI